MIFRKESRYKDSDQIIYLRKYHPYWDELHKKRNPLFNHYGKLILDVKSKNESAIMIFSEFLDKIVESGIAISVVPAHSKEELETGIKIIADIIAGNNRINATNCLVRTRNTKQQSRDGKKNIAENRETIKPKDTHIILNKPVLLLDDVVTTGNSLNTCRNILIRSRAKMVQCLALGKTYRKAPVKYFH